MANKPDNPYVAPTAIDDEPVEQAPEFEKDEIIRFAGRVERDCMLRAVRTRFSWVDTHSYSLWA